MIKNRGEFSKPAPFNYQSHQSLQKFRKMPIEQRADQLSQDIFKVKVKGQLGSKLIAARNVVPSKQQQNKELKKQIKVLENQLKRKILQNPLLSRIFKTKQSTNNELSHVDLYLQFIKIKQQQELADHKSEQILSECKKKQMAYQLEISQLKEEIQQRQQSFIHQIERATEKFEKIQREFKKKMNEKQKVFEQQTIEREGKIQDVNLILEQLKRKNHKLAKQNKELQAKVKELKNTQHDKVKSQQQKLKSLKFQYQSYKQKAEAQKTSINQQVEKQRQNFKDSQQKLKRQISTLQNQVAQKAHQIEQLDRFIELQKDSFQTQIQQLKHSYQGKIHDSSSQKTNQLFRYKQEAQKQMKKMLKDQDEKLKELNLKHQGEQNKVKADIQNQQKNLQTLKNLLAQKQKAAKKFEEEVAQFKRQTDFQIQQSKGFNNQLIGEKQSLSKKLTQSQLKLQKMTKQIQHLTYQRGQLHSKYEKGFINTEKDIKHYQTIVQELERKIYILGNQNIGLKKSVEEKHSVESKVKEFNKMSEQTYQQKYKAIGRIEQIRHKLENCLVSDFGRSSYGCFSTTFSNCSNNNTNNYRSNSHFQNSSLTDCLQALSLLLDKLFQNYFSLNHSIQTVKKQKVEDQRQFQSILNHFIDMEERESELQETLISYINVRKQLSKQTMSSQSECGEEYLLQRKRQMCQSVIQKLIQLKVIKQYSSADNAVSNIRVSKEQKSLNLTKRAVQFDSNGSSNQNNRFLSNPASNHNSRNSRKSLKKLMEQEQYRSVQSNLQQQNNQEQYYSNDSLQGIHKRVLFDNKQQKIRQKNSSNAKSRQALRHGNIGKDSSVTRYRSRISTQPNNTDDDIEEQSTYQIIDENLNYGNFIKKSSSKNNLLDKKAANSKNQAEEKLILHKRYKEQIKQKLMSGKGKKESSLGLSKQDIEKKYFLR